MRNWVLYLHDINEAISTIHEFIAGMTLEEFSLDKKTMSAVRDQIMIIGEAVNHLPDEILSEYPQVPWRDIVGMRNVLVHSYFRTDPELLFLVATERLASLSMVITGMIKEYRL
ncbi:DUF86 domain-containing protein [uncultured Methanospirillum sp.]|uniref:HepT-like ribonuclease domain-containing protein n=1 Tax=uncultured Methanospirillum sp. TaxID=262503 RepID=UPI0029C6D786|nr:DUF86 domain-containing protein [uncultured Methanospirillum sp.]